MSELEQRLTDAGLGRVASKLALLASETVRLTAIKHEEEPTSRLGGRPNLAPNLTWPEWDEEPLAFVAQLDLAAIPEIAGFNLPRSGALYFFYRVMRHARTFKARIGRNPATGEVIKIPARKVAKSQIANPAKSSDRRNFRVLLAIELHPDVLEGALLQVVLTNQIIEASHVAPNDVGRLLRIDQEERLPILHGSLGLFQQRLVFLGGDGFASGGISSAALDNDPALWPLCLEREEQALYLSFVRQLMESRETFRGRAGSDIGEHALGGYPNYIQHDPRLRAELITTGLYPRGGNGIESSAVPTSRRTPWNRYSSSSSLGNPYRGSLARCSALY
jgi:uncharacterized protein YwqG